MSDGLGESRCARKRGRGPTGRPCRRRAGRARRPCRYCRTAPRRSCACGRASASCGAGRLTFITSSLPVRWTDATLPFWSKWTMQHRLLGDVRIAEGDLVHVARHIIPVVGRELAGEARPAERLLDRYPCCRRPAGSRSTSCGSSTTPLCERSLRAAGEQQPPPRWSPSSTPQASSSEPSLDA